MMQIFNIYRRIARLVPRAGLVLIGIEEDVESGAAHETWVTLGRRELFERLAETLSVEGLAEVSSFDDVRHCALDAFSDGYGYYPRDLVTPEEARQRRAEEKRQRLEEVARTLARQHNVQVGSFGFIDACYAAIERLKTYREGMREDGPCMGWGVTAAQWNDEYNASQGDTATVYEVLAWLEQECPLLMAQARERRLRGEPSRAEGV